MLRPSTIKMRTEGFPSGATTIWLPRRPLRELTSISFLDPSGDRQTLAAEAYACDLFSESPRLAPRRTWPSHRKEPGSIVLEVKAGYAATADIPPAVLRAISLLAADYYEGRVPEGSGDTLPGPVVALVRRWLA